MSLAGDEDLKISILSELSVAVSDEDHTLMNPLRWAVSNNWLGDKVEFCGYTIPHPSDKICNFNVQFSDKNTQTSKNVLKKMYEGLECVELVFNKILEKLN
jgi:DNA-directed RNA polymerase I and III subunit RPAC2